jgi:hypothetical protein
MNRIFKNWNKFDGVEYKNNSQEMDFKKYSMPVNNSKFRGVGEKN